MKLAALLLVGCTISTSELGTSEQATTVCALHPSTVKGMDVSSYETSIDWPTAKANGIDFAFIRVSDGLQYHDPKFATYWAGAAAAGVYRGAYQFFRPDQDPIAQADYLLAQLGPHTEWDLPPAIDVEVTEGLEPAEVAAAVRKWIDHVEAAIGRPPIIYAGYYSWQDYVGDANLTAYPLWHAQYTSAACPNIPTPWTRWTIWQYSSTGTVPKVVGEATDLDEFDGTLDDLAAFAAGPPPACGTIAADGGVIDDSDACFGAGGPTASMRHATDAGQGGSLTWTKTTAAALIGNFGTWSLSLAEAGHYRVEVSTPAAYAQSTDARYHLRAGGVEQDVAIDQTAGEWQALGDFAFDAGGDQFVELDDNTGESGKQLVFDAVRLTRLDRAAPMPTPPGEIEAPVPTDGGGCATSSASSLACALALLGLRRRRPSSAP